MINQGQELGAFSSKRCETNKRCFVDRERVPEVLDELDRRGVFPSERVVLHLPSGDVGIYWYEAR